MSPSDCFTVVGQSHTLHAQQRINAESMVFLQQVASWSVMTRVFLASVSTATVRVIVQSTAFEHVVTEFASEKGP